MLSWQQCNLDHICFRRLLLPVHSCKGQGCHSLSRKVPRPSQSPRDTWSSLFKKYLACGLTLQVSSQSLLSALLPASHLMWPFHLQAHTMHPMCTASDTSSSLTKSMDCFSSYSVLSVRLAEHGLLHVHAATRNITHQDLFRLLPAFALLIAGSSSPSKMLLYTGVDFLHSSNCSTHCSAAAAGYCVSSSFTPSDVMTCFVPWHFAAADCTICTHAAHPRVCSMTRHEHVRQQPSGQRGHWLGSVESPAGCLQQTGLQTVGTRLPDQTCPPPGMDTAPMSLSTWPAQPENIDFHTRHPTETSRQQ